MAREHVTILGSTGSIGVSTLDVLARQPERFGVHALTAHANVAKLAEQCLEHRPAIAVMVDREAASALRDLLARAGSATRVLAAMTMTRST